MSGLAGGNILMSSRNWRLRVMKLSLFTSMLLALPLAGLAAPAILVEAEGFENYGGWSLDTQFMDEMGAP
jgi:hypothetical protein